MPRRLASAPKLALLVLAMVPPDAFAQDPPPGASSCSGCHASAAAAVAVVPPIYGRPKAETARAMLDFKSGARPATVMGRIAKGFSDGEIEAIAQWIGAQTR